VDGLLASLTPLATLLSRSSDPSAVRATLATVLDPGSPPPAGEIFQRCFGADAASAPHALDAARITTGGTDWKIRLAQAEILALEIQRNRLLAPCLAMTVPDFLRTAWAGHLRAVPAADWPRETWPAILDLASQAASELLLAAPFLSTEHARALAACIAHLTEAGGQVLLVTQASDAEPNLSSVRLLRDAVHAQGRIEIWSWPGPGLGIHFKAVIADRQQAYIGSANLTTHAAIRQAEAGVILRGPLAHQLDQWIRRIAAHQLRQEGLT
jgi:phosphatidylserine/phosphatidylglycerophosphate/cardiolipin synthase-like enzyme